MTANIKGAVGAFLYNKVADGYRHQHSTGGLPLLDARLFQLPADTNSTTG